MVQFGQPAWLTDILDRLELRLVQAVGLPRDKVFTYLGEPSDLLQSPPGDRFVSVGAMSMAPDQSAVAGGGAAQTCLDSVVTVNCFARIGTDQELRDIRLLRDRSNGLGQLVLLAMKSVQVWAADVDGLSLLREPARVAGEVRFNPRRPKTGWAYATVPVRCRFRADLS